MMGTSSCDRNPPNFTLDLVSYRSAISTTYVGSGIKTHFVLAFVCLDFALSDTEGLKSIEELFFTRVVAVNSFARVLNPWEGSVYLVKSKIVGQTVLFCLGRATSKVRKSLNLKPKIGIVKTIFRLVLAASTRED